LLDVRLVLTHDLIGDFIIRLKVLEFHLAAAGLAAGAVGGFVLARIAESYLAEAQFPDAGPLLASALVLLAAALVASAFPAARAARIDVMQALRSD
jgi:ABC-type antimicrobial peptide transport system permease subunit